MAQLFNFNFGSDDIDNDVKAEPPTDAEKISKGAVGQETPLVEPQLHTLEEMVSCESYD